MTLVVGSGRSQEISTVRYSTSHLLKWQRQQGWTTHGAGEDGKHLALADMPQGTTALENSWTISSSGKCVFSI